MSHHPRADSLHLCPLEDEVTIVRMLATAVASLLVAACNTGPGTCAGYGDFAISAEIRDARTGKPIAHGGTVLELREGAFIERIIWETGSADSLRLRAGYERPGTYNVIVTRPGYATWTRTAVRVRRDDCGQLLGAVLRVALEPQAGV